MRSRHSRVAVPPVPQKQINLSLEDACSCRRDSPPVPAWQRRLRAISGRRSVGARQVAALFGCSVADVRRRVAHGELVRPVRIGRRLVWDVEWLARELYRLSLTGTRCARCSPSCPRWGAK